MKDKMQEVSAEGVVKCTIFLIEEEIYINDNLDSGSKSNCYM